MWGYKSAEPRVLGHRMCFVHRSQGGTCSSHCGAMGKCNRLSRSCVYVWIGYRRLGRCFPVPLAHEGAHLYSNDAVVISQSWTFQQCDL
jgi:hypothetical protein